MWTTENRACYDRSRLRYPSDVTDEEWALIAPHIPPAKPGGNKRTVDLRAVVNGLMYILSTGCQWRAIPNASIAGRSPSSNSCCESYAIPNDVPGQTLKVTSGHASGHVRQFCRRKTMHFTRSCRSCADRRRTSRTDHSKDFVLASGAKIRSKNSVSFKSGRRSMADDNASRAANCRG